MLVVSELSEALEIHRKASSPESLVIPDRVLQDGVEHPDEGYSEFMEDYIKDTWGDELADAMIRLMDLAEGTGVNLEKHIELKLRYNKLRPHKHGKNY